MGPATSPIHARQIVWSATWVLVMMFDSSGGVICAWRGDIETLAGAEYGLRGGHIRGSCLGFETLIGTMYGLCERGFDGYYGLGAHKNF